MARTPHRLAALGSILTLLALVALREPAIAQGGTPATASVAVPATPVGDQLTWVLDQLNGDAAALTETEIAERFDPLFLIPLPAPALLGLMQETATQYGPFTLTGFAYPPTETGATALVRTGDGMAAAITITVAAEPPHRISRLEFGEPPPPESPDGRRVDIGGRSLYLECAGEGSPTVVLEGGVAPDWAAVQPQVAGQIRVCSYDRPDAPQTRSDPTSDRTAQQVVDDLHALLTAAGEAGPYVLVGHSLGGLYVQLYAYQYPEEVAGLVLVDPTPEEFTPRLVALLRSLGTPIPEQPSGPVTVEQVTMEQVREARAGGPLPQVPLVVISHGLSASAEERPPGWPVEQEEALFRQLHEELVASVPGARHVIAEASTHNVHQEQPDLVIAAITDVVDAARDPASWATPSATPAPGG
jgi:pimeloyl-ACP methyl ester carboxylesterase